MKKKFWKFAMCGLLLVGATCVISCGDDGPGETDGNNSEVNNGGNNGGTGGNGTGSAAMTPLQQKEYMQKVAENLINTLPAADSKALCDLGKYIGNTYMSGNYNWDNVGVWAKKGFDAAYSLISSSEEKHEDTYYTQIYKYSFYARTLLASNFLGKFTAANGTWNYEPSDILQFIFSDQNGAPCELKLTTSGSVKKVHLTDIEDKNYDWIYDYNKGNYTTTTYTDVTSLTVGIPEKIQISLTQGGKQVVTSTIETKLESLDGEEFNLAQSNLTFSVKTELNNGCQLNLNQMAYTANSKAAISYEMLKNGNSVCSVSISGDPMNLPSCNLSVFTVSGANAGNFDNINAKNAYMKIDILGQLQLQGSMKDIRQFATYINEAGNYVYDEKTFKSYINQANGMLNDFGMYFNNTNVKQASVKLESFLEKSWNKEYWTAEPVIEFYDGTSYSTVTAFFNEQDFKNTINAFTSLAESYANLVNGK